MREKLRVRDEELKGVPEPLRTPAHATSRGTSWTATPSFVDDSSFRLHVLSVPEAMATIPLGLYELPRRSGEAHLYRLNHPLAEAMMAPGERA